MAWLEERKRGSGGVSVRVVWRLGGTRDGAQQVETFSFSVGTNEQNLARATNFMRLVDMAGQRWPDGWVKGEGFLRPHSEPDPLTKPPTFVEFGEVHVRQIVDLSPGQRKRYLGQLGVLKETEVRKLPVHQTGHRTDRG